MKIIDPNCVRELPWARMQSLVDVMARGLTNNESSVISQQFALNVMKLLELEGCIIRSDASMMTPKKEEDLDTT